MKYNYDITVEMKIQNLGYFINFRGSRAPDSKYGPFGSFLGLPVPFGHSVPEICKLVFIGVSWGYTKSNEKQNFKNFQKHGTLANQYHTF